MCGNFDLNNALSLIEDFVLTQAWIQIVLRITFPHMAGEGGGARGRGQRTWRMFGAKTA